MSRMSRMAVGSRSSVTMNVNTQLRIKAPKPEISLVRFLESLELDGLDLTRDSDLGRDTDL